MHKYFTNEELEHYVTQVNPNLQEFPMENDKYETRCFYDEETDKFIDFVMPDKMTTEWLAEKIYVSPNSPVEIDKIKMAKIILNTFDKNTLITLKNIYLVNGDDDCDAIEDISGTDEARYVFDTESYVGLMWFYENSVFVDLKQHYEFAQKAAEEDYVNPRKEFEYTVLETLIHELRHLMLETNIAIDWYSEEEREEDFVEEYCRNSMNQYYRNCCECFTN